MCAIEKHKMVCGGGKVVNWRIITKLKEKHYILCLFCY